MLVGEDVRFTLDVQAIAAEEAEEGAVAA